MASLWDSTCELWSPGHRAPVNTLTTRPRYQAVPWVQARRKHQRVAAVVRSVRVAITDSVDAAKHRCSFGDPRTRPSAAGVARRHSPSVHWWHSWRGRPLRREQRLQATWLVAQPVVRSVESTAAGGGGAAAVRAVGSGGERGPGRGTLPVRRQRWCR